MINGKMEPLLIEGGQFVKTLSIGFLADLEEDWRAWEEGFPSAAGEIQGLVTALPRTRGDCELWRAP